ncbi:hypothetical protein Nepgr_016578 [Nepenthes gracilis]|uniref:Uncharacterized protein n=1 Tax=Nepenthes gracilis TaxID=150966 RepID=A0AAD3SPJ8_NEPGR|nr:hypothetical protein Nepgr_016578 [Nepenthes gracilis]
MSFLWLQFSQSFQVLGIIFTTMVSSVVYGYRFWKAVGLPSACFPFVLNCQIVLSGCNLVGHIGVLEVPFIKGRCNGIGAWWFNSVLNAVILILFLNFYTNNHLRKGGFNGGEAEDHSRCPSSTIDNSKQGRSFSRKTKKFGKHVKNSAMKSGGRR